MNDLPLEVCEIDNVEVNYPQAPYTGSRKIHRQRRPQPARAYAQHTRGFQLFLTFERDLGHYQVPAVAQDLIAVQLDRLRVFDSGRSSGDRGHDADRVPLLDRSLSLARIANVLVIDINVYEMPKLAFFVVEMLA